MKKIIYSLSFILLMCYTLSAVSQNFQTVRSGRETMFYNGSGFFGFRVDSSRLDGSDTLLYCLRLPGIHEGTGCYMPFSTSFLGDSIRVKPDGWNIFYIGRSHLSMINTLATTGQSWTFASLDTGSYIKATVTGIQDETVLGLTDSVKTIVLQAMNAGNNPVSWTYNGTNLKISKNYGFTQWLSLYQMLTYDPGYIYNGANYSLVGCSNPLRGVQNLRWRDIFDYSVGDEIMTEAGQSSDYTDFIQTKELILQRLTDRSFSINGDTAYYTWKRCGDVVHDTGGIETHQGYEDTIVEKIDLVNPIFDGLPYECSYKEPLYVTYAEMFQNYNRTCKSENIEWYYYVYDSCWTKVIVEIGCDSLNFTHYVQGCGGPYSVFENCGSYPPSYRKLLYYKKGSEVFGSPFSCETIVNGIALNEAQHLKVRVFPNPMSNSGTLELSMPAGITATFTLYDYLGNEVLKQVINSPTTGISRNDLASGMYLYRINTSNGGLYSGKWVVQ